VTKSDKKFEGAQKKSEGRSLAMPALLSWSGTRQFQITYKEIDLTMVHTQLEKPHITEAYELPLKFEYCTSGAFK